MAVIVEVVRLVDARVEAVTEEDGSATESCPKEKSEN
jgi:hypothetical protein